MIDVAALSALRAVSATGSVSGAAELLGFTPSAVSQQVKRLERQTGVALLERVGRGVLLTRQGHLLVDAGGDVLGRLEALEADLHREAGSVAGVLRLGAFSTAVRGLLAPRLPALLAAHPALEVRIQEVEPWQTLDLVASGQLDVGVVHSWGDLPLRLPEQVEAETLTRDVAEVLLHRDHPLAAREELRPADLVGVDWITTGEDTICREWLERMFTGTGRRPRIAHRAMEFDSHLALVAAGLGVALVPRLGRSPLPDGVLARPVRDPDPVRHVAAVHRTSSTASPAVAALVSALRDPSPDH